MPQARAERPSFTFNKGLNTDAPALVFPPDFSSDESNFELMLDGTRRRRRGLELESTAVAGFIAPENGAVRTFKWRAVAGNPDLNFHVWQVGNTLHFANDVAEPSTSLRNFTLDLVGLLVDGTYETVQETLPVDMAFGKGQAVLVGRYIEPTLLTYDEVTDGIQQQAIKIRQRDFQGLEDGIDNQTKPGTLSNEYLYNLVNEGWKYGDVLLYFTSESEYPAKNMISFMGYRRQTVPGFAEQDGTRQFSPDKLVAELFQDAPAPTGHFIQNPFDTTVDLIVETETIKNYIDSWDPVSPNSLNLPVPGGPNTQTLVTTTMTNPHFLNVGGNVEWFTETAGRIGSDTGDHSRTWYLDNLNTNVTVESVPSTTSFSWYLGLIDDHAHWNTSKPWAYYPVAYSFSGGTHLQIPGAVIDDRPTSTAFFAGRAWYSGIPHPKLGASLYFSQVVESDAQYGKCYQVADPTDENISDLIATDGGVLRIPEVGRVYRILPYSSRLVVFASNGLWEIGPGATGYFTANSYSVRKIADLQAVNAQSVVQAEEIPAFWAKSGIFAIVQDSNTGFLTTQSLTKDKIDNLYSEISDANKATSTGDFDTKNKRLIWTFDHEETTNALVFDTRFSAFTPYKFSAEVYDTFTTTDPDPASNSTLKFIVRQESDGLFYVATPSSLTFTDLGVDYDAYIVGGFDTASSPSKYKYAPVITVFMARTEQEDGQVDEMILPVLSGEVVLDSNTLTWTAANTTGSPIDFYQLERSIDSGAYSLIATVDASAPRTFTDSGTTAFLEYHYRVRAINEASFTTAYSNVVTLTREELPDFILLMHQTGIYWADDLSLANPWTAGTGLPTSDWRCAAHNATSGRTVALALSTSGSSTTHEAAAYSDDQGHTWTLIPAFTTVGWNDIAYSPTLNLWAGVKQSGFLTTPDGINYTTGALPSVNWRAIKWVPWFEGGKFVAGGVFGGGGTNYIVTSPDGVTWTEVVVPSLQGAEWLEFNDTTIFAPSSAVAAFFLKYDRPSGPWSRTAFSPDLLNTGATSSSAFNNQLITSSTSYTIESLNAGSTWSFCVDSRQTASFGVVYRGEKLVIAGTALQKSTDNGVHWSTVFTPPATAMSRMITARQLK